MESEGGSPFATPPPATPATSAAASTATAAAMPPAAPTAKGVAASAAATATATAAAVVGAGRVLLLLLEACRASLAVASQLCLHAIALLGAPSGVKVAAIDAAAAAAAIGCLLVSPGAPHLFRFAAIILCIVSVYPPLLGRLLRVIGEGEKGKVWARMHGQEQRFEE